MIFNKFSDLRDLYREAARTAFRDLQSRCRGESIYAFALVTDDEVMGASPDGNTEERLAKTMAAHPPQGLVERLFNEWGFRWDTGDWDSIYSEEAPCTTRPRISLKEEFEGMLAFRREWTSIPGNSERMFRRNVLRAMVDALKDLDREGLFGEGEQRRKITLFLEITDSNDDIFVKLASARMLNPRASRIRLTHSLPLVVRLAVSVVSMFRSICFGPFIAKHTAP